MKRTIQEWKEFRAEWRQDTNLRLEWVLIACTVTAFILSRSVFSQFLCSIPIEALIGIASLVLVVIIPLAVLMIDSSESGVKFVSDKQVGIDRVLNVPLLVTTLIILIMPTILLWNYSHGHSVFRSLLLSLFVLGIFLFILIMRSTYVWLMSVDIAGEDSYTNRKRLEYLEEIPEEQKKHMWPKVWRDKKGRELIGEEKLVRKFLIYLESLMEQTEKDRKYKGIPILQQFIDQLDTVDLQNPNTYELLANFTIRGTSIPISDERDEGMDVYYATFAGTPRLLFRSIMDLSMKNSFLAHMFFRNVQDFPWENEKSDKGKFIKIMTYEFFQSMAESGNPYSDSVVWEQFPKTWTLTAQNLKDKGNTFAQGWFRQYINWIIDRCYLGRSQNDEFDIDDMAESVTRHLLPLIDPVTWSTLLTFQLVPLDKSLNSKEVVEARIQGFIQENERFGFMSSTFVTTITDIEDMQKEHERAMKKQQEEVFRINKITGICPILLDVKQIEEYLTAVERFKGYKPKSREEYRRMRLIRILDAAKQWIANHNKA